MLQVGMYALFAAEIYAWFVVGALSFHTVENSHSGQDESKMSTRCQCRHLPFANDGHYQQCDRDMSPRNSFPCAYCQGVLSFVQAKLLDGASQFQGTRSEQES